MSSLIWTNHARERLHDRKMSQRDVENTFYAPDTREVGKEAGTTVFRKRFGLRTVTLIAKQNDRHEWIVVSLWIDPPYEGTQDERKRQLWRAYQRAGFWGKWWITLRRILNF